MKVINIIIQFFLFTYCLYSYAEEVREVTIAFENNAMPFSGTLNKGTSYKIINAIFKDSNYKVKPISVPYSRAVKMLEENKIDGALHVTKDVENSSIFLFSSEPFLILNAHLFYNFNTGNYKSLDEIPDNNAVGVMNSFEYGSEFNKNKHRFKISSVNDQMQLINLLKRNRIQISIMYDKIAKYKFKKISNSDTRIIKGLQFIQDVLMLKGIISKRIQEAE